MRTLHIFHCATAFWICCQDIFWYRRLTENGDDNDKFDERIQQINNYIRANYSQPISLKELSEKLYLSNGYLSRFFKRNYGMNFAEYLTNIRLFHAVDELLYTNTPITVIAFDNGFASVAVFNKAFKKTYGETPSAYRKKSKDTKEEQQNVEKDEQMDLQLEKFLIHNHTEKEKEKEIETQRNVHSVSGYTDLKHCWGRTINMGAAADILKSEIQEHIVILKDSINVEYIRFCNPFTKEMLIDYAPAGEKYNFTRIDNLLDFLLKLGIKPHFELGPKPRIITYNVQKMEMEGTRDVEFPDCEKWQNLLDAFLSHLVRRYGRTELDGWRMELWYNENKWDEEESSGEYFELFDILKNTVRKYSESLQVGGCGIRADYQLESRKDFYHAWKNREVQPDFLSFIAFAYDRGEEKNDRYAKRCTDNECMLHRIHIEKELIAEAGYERMPLYVTEWNLTASARNILNDTAFKGAYVIKNILDVYSEVEDMSYWNGSDRLFESYDTNDLLFGGNGLLSKDGVLKPTGFAFEFMNRLFPYYIGKGENYLISTDGHDSYGIVCHNQRPLGYNYYFTKEDELDREKIWKYFEDRDELELNLDLENLENGNYQMKYYRINENSGNALMIWKEMDFEPDLSRNDIRYFRRVCEPKLIIQKTDVKNRLLHLNITMQPNEFLFVRVRRIG